MKKLMILVILGLFAYSMVYAGEGEEKKTDGKKAEIAAKKEIVWMSYDEGRKLAKEKNLHILVNFTTSWCGWCKRMNKTTFLEPEVVKLMTEGFVNVKIDGEGKKELNIDGYKITEQSLTISEFGVKSYPTYWFLKPNGEKLGQLPGYQKADTFIEVLYFMKEGLYDKMTFQEYMEAGGRKGQSKG